MNKKHHSKERHERLTSIKKVRDFIAGQAVVHKAGECYLPKTAGMKSRGSVGVDHYNAYKLRARVLSLVQFTENGVIGLAFKNAPEVDVPFDVVTINGRTAEKLARDILREVLEAGDVVLVVDAPVGGGDPYIVEYKAENFINYAVSDSDDSKITAAMFSESYFDEDDTYQEEPIERYREYRLIDGKPHVRVLDEDENQIGEEVVLPFDYLPVFIAGSVDNHPSADPIPLLPVADAAEAIYQVSADYRQFLHNYGQKTPYATGVRPEEVTAILAGGFGVGAFLTAENESAKFGEIGGTEGSEEAFRKAIQDELLIAEQYAVTISQKGDGVESAESVRMRATAKQATIVTILNSISAAITSAVECMAQWSGRGGEVTVQLSTDFTFTEASDRLLTALNAAVASQVLPVSVPREYARRSGLTDKTDEEMDAEIVDRPF